MTGSPLRSRLMLVATAVLFSTGGAGIKAASLTSWQVASFRSLTAALALVLLVPESRRNWSPRLILPALAYAGALITFVVANKLTTSASAIYLQSTAPLYLLVLGPVLLKERIRPLDFAVIAALAAGMALFLDPHQSAQATAPDPRKGNLIAASSGIVWALSLVGLRWAEKGGRSAGISIVVLGNLLSGAIALPLALPVPSPSFRDVAIIMYLGVFQIGLAYYLLTKGVRHVPALESSTILLIEPALNPVWTWLIHGEQPGRRAILGGTVILAATALNAWIHARSDRNGRPEPVPD